MASAGNNPPGAGAQFGRENYIAPNYRRQDSPDFSTAGFEKGTIYGYIKIGIYPF